MVWDIWVRLGHWMIVALVAFQFYSGDSVNLREQHAWVGSIILAWVLFRLVWGFIGSRHALFADFLRGPIKTFKSFLLLFKRVDEPVNGHTAAGGVGIVLLLALLATLALTGLISTDDIFYDGPFNYLVSSDFASWARSTHLWVGNILLFVMGAHVAAVLWHQVIMKQKLIQAMFHGKKAPGIVAVTARDNIVGGALLAVCLAGLLGLVWGLGRF